MLAVATEKCTCRYSVSSNILLSATVGMVTVTATSNSYLIYSIYVLSLIIMMYTYGRMYWSYISKTDNCHPGPCV